MLLMGRFLTTKLINLRAAKNLLRSVWKMGSDLKITNVGDGLRDGEETPYGEWLRASFRRPKFQQTWAPPTPPRWDQGDKVQGLHR